MLFNNKPDIGLNVMQTLKFLPSIIIDDYLIYQNKKIRFSVINKENTIIKKIPYFVGVIRTVDEKDMLCISSEVPTYFREFMLIYCIELSKVFNKPGGYLEALEMELKKVPKKIFDEYIKFRILTLKLKQNNQSKRMLNYLLQLNYKK